MRGACLVQSSVCRLHSIRSGGERGDMMAGTPLHGVLLCAVYCLLLGSLQRCCLCALQAWWRWRP
jgi:hypothetical protein